MLAIPPPVFFWVISSCTPSLSRMGHGVDPRRKTRQITAFRFKLVPPCFDPAKLFRVWVSCDSTVSHVLGFPHWKSLYVPEFQRNVSRSFVEVVELLLKISNKWSGGSFSDALVLKELSK